MKGRVVAVCLSERKGTSKRPVPEGHLKEDYGLVGDAHARPSFPRQISLLSIESIRRMREQGYQVGPGDFAENLTVEGLNLQALRPGSRIQVGEAIIEVTQRGKECRDACEIGRQLGKCIMPVEGLFARVLKGGRVKPGDEIKVL